MSAPSQDELKGMWLGSRAGTLCAREQAKAWALREIWKAKKESCHGLCAFVAKRVRKSGPGGTPTARSAHPTGEAISQLFDRMDADAQWFPGKRDPDAAPPGPQPILRGVKRQAVAAAAQAIKRRGGEPTYSAVVAACPTAALNPDTGRPVQKDRVYTVLKADCYDDGAEVPWEHTTRSSKGALTPTQESRRMAWAGYMQGLNHRDTWYYENLVWTDLCNSIRALTEKKEQELALARKAGKSWMIPGSEMHATNLRGPKATLKMNSWDTERLWWAPVLAKGKLHVEVLPEDFPGETEAGAAILVAKVRAAPTSRFRDGAAPGVVFVDRGKGFYNAGSGAVTQKFSAALREHRLRAFMGANAAVQPGALQELMLHETAVSWIRLRLAETKPSRPWDESRTAYGQRLKRVVQDINMSLDVEGLCRALPRRVQELRDRQGGRLSH